jgi:hypothetical protein
MLGPIDLEDWRDEDEELCARLFLRPEIQLLRGRPKLAALPGWSAGDFALARRFSAGETLDPDEIRLLAHRLGA